MPGGIPAASRSPPVPSPSARPTCARLSASGASNAVTRRRQTLDERPNGRRLPPDAGGPEPPGPPAHHSMTADRRAPLLAKGTYRVERRVVHTSSGIKQVISLDTIICRECRAAMHPDMFLHPHPYLRWRYVSGLADKMTEVELAALLSADVANLLGHYDLGSGDAGNVS
jgi:hypothetical protein